MFDDVIKLSRQDSDLPLPTVGESWIGDTFEVRRKTVLDYIESQNGFPPSSKLFFILKGVFKITPATTLESVISLTEKIREKFVIDCFQIILDREKSEATLLFDCYDRKKMVRKYLNRSEQVILSVIILQCLDLPRPEGTENWIGYFLRYEYGEDKDIFDRLFAAYEHSGLDKRSYELTRDIIEYIKLMCQKRVK